MAKWKCITPQKNAFLYETAVIIKIWHVLLFHIIICTVKAYVFRIVTMNSEDHVTMHMHDGPWTPAAFTARHQPTHSPQLSRHLLYPDLHSVNLLPTPSAVNKYYRLAQATKLTTIHIWLNLGLSIRSRSLFFYPAQIILHAAPQTECILCIYWDILYISGWICVYVVCMWCFLSTRVFIQCLSMFRAALVSVQSVAWHLECKILMCTNISTQPQGFKCKGLCKWIAYAFYL